MSAPLGAYNLGCKGRTTQDSEAARGMSGYAGRSSAHAERGGRQAPSIL